MAIIYDLLELNTAPGVGHTLGVSGSGADVTFLGVETKATVQDDVYDSSGGLSHEAGLYHGSSATQPAEIDGIQHDVTSIQEVTYDLGGTTYTGHVITVAPLTGGDTRHFFIPEDGSDPVLGVATILSATTIYFVDADTLAIDDTVTFPPCYAAGTLITTPAGPRPVEDLRPGDPVITLDHGVRPVRWVHSGDQLLERCERDTRPILLRAGALGRNRPARDLVLSPQHRLLVGGAGQLEPHFTAEALAPGKALTALPGIRHMMGKKRITWHHFACDRHEVVFANGCLAESLLLGPMVLNSLSPGERQALQSIFAPARKSALTPACEPALNGPPARPCLSVGAARRRIADSLKRAKRGTGPGRVGCGDCRRAGCAPPDGQRARLGPFAFAGLAGSPPCPAFSGRSRRPSSTHC